MGLELVRARRPLEAAHALDLRAPGPAGIDLSIPRIQAAYETHFRVEVFPDVEVRSTRVPLVGFPAEVCGARDPVTAAINPGRGEGLCEHARGAPVAPEDEAQIDAGGSIERGPGPALAIEKDRAEGGLSKNVSLHPSRRVIAALAKHSVGAGRIVRLHVQQAQGVRTRATGDLSAGHNRHLLPGHQADAPRIEEGKQAAAAPITPASSVTTSEAHTGPPVVEDAGALREELPLLREEHGEAGEIHDFLVGLNLGEIGLVGEIGGERTHEANPGVKAITRPGLRAPGHVITGHRRGEERDDLHAAPRFQVGETHELSRPRHPGET